MKASTQNNVAMVTSIAVMVFVIVLVIVCFAAWVTHIIVGLTQHAWLLLIAGGIVAPVGVIHGIGYWFGFFH